MFVSSSDLELSVSSSDTLDWSSSSSSMRCICCLRACCADGKSDSALSFVLALFSEREDALIKSAEPFGSRLIVLLSDKFELEWSGFCPGHKGSRKISTLVASLVRVEDLFLLLLSLEWKTCLPSGVSLEDLLCCLLVLT